jgi:hypothetical protein
VRCGNSHLTFRPDGEQATLEGLAVAHDRGGAFFHRVVTDLMSRYHGDLHVKLTWSGSAQPSSLGLGEVRIERGEATYPALRMKNVVSMLRGAAEPLFANDPKAAEAPDEAEASEDEIEKLLERARAEFAEYQRLRKGQ